MPRDCELGARQDDYSNSANEARTSFIAAPSSTHAADGAKRVFTRHNTSMLTFSEWLNDPDRPLDRLKLSYALHVTSTPPRSIEV